jgi:DnaJ-domain-containing protein 1
MTLIAGLVAVVTLYLVLQMLRTANPAVVARGVKIGGGIAALGVAAFVGIRGELAVAIPLGIFGAGLLGWSPFGMPGFFSRTQQSPGRTSHVRSQFLDMMLDHDSGDLRGQIIAGEHHGRSLDEFDLSQLVGLAETFDPESRALLESYLDRRFAGWREDPKSNGAGRQGGQVGRPPSGKMTEEEAYQILGVQAGASADEISRAHRSLMKKLHPDQGGSTYLASRVNEAKDTLLHRHRS